MIKHTSVIFNHSTSLTLFALFIFFGWLGHSVLCRTILLLRHNVMK